LTLDRDRFRGSLVGLAVGDSLGAAVEFKRSGQFEPVTGYRQGGPWNLKPGYWTDDTSMALCLAESLLACHGFDPADQMTRYVHWWREGHLSSTGTCFDIGPTTRAALQQYVGTGDPYSGSTAPETAGNGSLMRLAPVPLYFAADCEVAVERAADSSRTTHGAAEAVDACRFAAALICTALNGRSREDLTGHALLRAGQVSDPVRSAATDFYSRSAPPILRTNGYVIESLRAALWGFQTTDNFRDGALAVVNLGWDADTNGAIYGQLAGAFYGLGGMPSEWVSGLHRSELILGFADRLFEAATGTQGSR